MAIPRRPLRDVLLGESRKWLEGVRLNGVAMERRSWRSLVMLWVVVAQERQWWAHWPADPIAWTSPTCIWMPHLLLSRGEAENNKLYQWDRSTNTYISSIEPSTIED